MRRNFLFRKSNSGEIARGRLKLLLVSDQAGCSPGLMEGVREDLIRVLSRYAEFDSAGLDLSLTRMESTASGEDVPALWARVPIRQFTTMRNA